jgi:hypothetical protein
MPGERQAIHSPLTVDLSQRLVKPALFVVQQTREPKGIVEHVGEGVAIAHTPWYSEFNLRFVGLEGVYVLYLMPYTDDTDLLFASIDHTFERFFTCLSGADFGDELTKLVALQWPELYAMLLHSNRRSVGQMMLFNTVMGDRLQWAVGRTVPATQDEFSPELALNIIASALEVFLRTSDPVALSKSLPGLVDVFGGPNLLMRRLNATGELLASTADLTTGIADIFQGTPDVEAIVKSSRDMVKHVASLMKDR